MWRPKIRLENYIVLFLFKIGIVNKWLRNLGGEVLKKPITKSVTYKAPGNSESCEAYIPFFENG